MSRKNNISENPTLTPKKKSFLKFKWVCFFVLLFVVLLVIEIESGVFSTVCNKITALLGTGENAKDCCEVTKDMWFQNIVDE